MPLLPVSITEGSSLAGFVPEPLGESLALGSVLALRGARGSCAQVSLSPAGLLTEELRAGMCWH